MLKGGFLDTQDGEGSGLGKSRTSDLLKTYTYILSAVGYALLLGWELSTVFAPPLPLLSFVDIDIAAILRLISILVLATTFILFTLNKDWVFIHRDRILFLCFFLAVFAIGNSLVNHIVSDVPLIVSVFAWACLGFAQAGIMMYWCVYLSFLPTKRTAITVAAGSVFGTLLFFLTNTNGSDINHLLEVLLLVIGSTLLVHYLSQRIPPEKIHPVEEYLTPMDPGAPARLSLMSYGAVYGFIALLICFMGPLSVLIVAASGVVGTLVALMWTYLSPKIEMDAGLLHRISLPLLVGGLLLFPFCDETGRIICGCVVNASLAHSQVFAWYSTSIDNAEFKLQPVGIFVIRQASVWTGFLVGALSAFLITFVFPVTVEHFMLIAVLFALVIIVIFCVYGGDESKTKRWLNELLTSTSELPDAMASPNSEEKSLASFKDRCRAVCEHYELSPRETEVFMLLAKGRNAVYIGEQLFVSGATVKSHIYHIYQKLGINSQQRLMTIVDETSAE